MEGGCGGWGCLWQNRVGGRAQGSSVELVLVRRVPVEGVGHEEDVGAGRDKGVARFHNLKAQETERAHQLGCRVEGEKRRKSVTTRTTPSFITGPEVRFVYLTCGQRRRTTFLSVLVKADKHAVDFQMFLSILQESCQTGRKEGTSHS